jgi:hypothetical protein
MKYPLLIGSFFDISWGIMSLSFNPYIHISKRRIAMSKKTKKSGRKSTPAKPE